MADLRACFSTGKDDWETPDDLFQKLAGENHFVVDAAANEFNHKCLYWMGPGGIEECALKADWQEWLKLGDVWLNPPYSRVLQHAFIYKARYEVTVAKIRGSMGKVVCLLPARTDTELFHKYIYKKDYVQYEFLKGRLKFKGAKHGAPFPSMIVRFL